VKFFALVRLRIWSINIEIFLGAKLDPYLSDIWVSLYTIGHSEMLSGTLLRLVLHLSSAVGVGKCFLTVID
jgi:hypothetical protein